MPVRKAEFTDDAAICAIAKLSKYTRDFTSHRFFRADIENTYAKGEVGVAQLRKGARIQGFVYVKHLKRKPYSVIHYMATLEKGSGVGRLLLEWALKQSPHGLVELSCEDANAGALAFYSRCGFEAVGHGVYGGKRPYTRFRKCRT